MSTIVWPAKDPQETVVADFDFAAELDGATIQDPVTFGIAVRIGVDPDAAAMISGTPEQDAGIVLQRIQAGLDGCNYGIRCIATLSDGRTLVRGAVLPVRWAA